MSSFEKQNLTESVSQLDESIVKIFERNDSRRDTYFDYTVVLKQRAKGEASSLPVPLLKVFADIADPFSYTTQYA